MTVRKKQSVKAPRVWQRMLSGRRLDLAHPSPMDVEIEDIAHGLARVARWNGQTKGENAFSVAEHSVIVERICRKLDPTMSAKHSLMALLHDSPEYVIGDMISPFKALLGEGYKDIEGRLQEAIHIRFGLPPVTPSAPEEEDQESGPDLCLVRGDATGRVRRGRGQQAVCRAAGKCAPEALPEIGAGSTGGVP
jgi:hypothetical protein